MHRGHILYLLFATITYLRVTNYCQSYFIWKCTEVVEQSEERGRSFLGIEDKVLKFRELSNKKIKQNLPSPHSELLGGVLLGINDINNTPTFNDVVRDVGTVHVIVVSGYNINLVFAFVYRIIGKKYSYRNLLIALTATLVYAVISGFDPPVVRAWIMGSIVCLGTFYGRKIDVTQILLFSGFVMVSINPTYLYSLSFQLSFLAALGLIMFADLFSGLFKSKNALFSDLISTLAAQVLVWPLIAYHFERVSIISPLVNSLVLWLIPLSTVVGGLYLVASFLNVYLGQVFSYIIMVPLDIFIEVCYFFSTFPYSNIIFKPSIQFIWFYYFMAMAVPRLLKKNEFTKVH